MPHAAELLQEPLGLGFVLVFELAGGDALGGAPRWARQASVMKSSMSLAPMRQMPRLSCLITAVGLVCSSFPTLCC